MQSKPSKRDLATLGTTPEENRRKRGFPKGNPVVASTDMAARLGVAKGMLSPALGGGADA